MRYEILGPLRVVDNDVAMSIGARKMEVLLGALLIRHNDTVSTDQIIGEIWGERPPRRATAALHVYISQLRKFLRTHGRQDSPIVTRSAGYSLEIGSDEFDLYDFQDLVAKGRACVAEGDHDSAITKFDSALKLVHGPVLAGDVTDGVIVSGFVNWFGEIQLECVQLMTSSYLAVGRNQELVGMLSTLVVKYPLNEEFYWQLMVALYRCRRRADALKVYQSARQTLQRELGLEPCRALRDLQQTILAAEEEVDMSSRLAMVR